jgi:hypothetical protein
MKTLISNAQAGKMDLNVYIYLSISGTLVERGALSVLNRVSWFLDGLSEQLCDRAIEYFWKKGWRLSANDTGDKESSFDEFKQYVLTKARVSRMRVVRRIDEGIWSIDVDMECIECSRGSGIDTRSRVRLGGTYTIVRPENCGDYEAD